jgi:hypothetical protein
LSLDTEIIRTILSSSASLSALLSAAIAFVLNQYQSLRKSPILAEPFQRFAKYLTAGLVLSASSTFMSLGTLLVNSTNWEYVNGLYYLAIIIFVITILVIVAAMVKIYREVTRKPRGNDVAE